MEVIRGHATVAKNILNPIDGMEKTLDATPAKVSFPFQQWDSEYSW